MSVAGATEVPVAPLALYVAVLLTQRAEELARSARNTRRLLARGARETGRGHYPLLVALHALYPVALVAEVVALGARPGGLALAWLGLWLAAQALRYASVRSLGERWSTRVLVLPGEAPVRHGPYRWLKHPNYLAVVVEFVAAPMMFGAWRTAVAFSLVDLALLAVRIRREERALAEAAATSGIEAPGALC